MMSSEKLLISDRSKRPLDPEETGKVATESYWEPLPKRPRTIEEDLSRMLSMKAPDPPGHSLCGKRKISDDDSARYVTKSARSGELELPACDREERASEERNGEKLDQGHDDSMSVESDSSISEGAIKSAFFHLAFGRRDSNPSQRSTGNVNAVDSRIEDLIRRSRLEATMKSKSKHRKLNGMDIDVDDDKREKDEHAKSGDWLPGHG
mmetsp:Transcript_30749/g.70284  ORF Transcript_30749/g.70284 Transcript_30749/m.70284 type:complete len:208 (-) Transcript_30749:87-710(-)